MRIFLSVSLLVGCAASQPSDETKVDWRAGGKADGQSCDFRDTPAADYYKNFAYAPVDSDTGSWYRVGLTWDVKPTLDSGDVATATAYFLTDSRVIVDYQEEHATSPGEADVINQTVVVTHATIDFATRGITLAGLGAGTPLTVTSNTSCGPGIAFRYTSNVRSPGLSGQQAEVVAGLTTGRVVDPDHLDDLPAEMRQWFEEDVASGKIKVIHE